MHPVQSIGYAAAYPAYPPESATVLKYYCKIINIYPSYQFRVVYTDLYTFTQSWRLYRHEQ